MTTAEPANGVSRRKVSLHGSDDTSGPELKHNPDEVLRLWRKHVQKLKGRIQAQLQDQLNDIVDGALSESLQNFSQIQPHLNGKATPAPVQMPVSRTEKKDGGKVFVPRMSLLDELFEVDHIRSIYHMFLAVFLLFSLSTLTVDFLEHGRPVLKFDLLFFAFGNIGTVIIAWTVMFVYTLLVPYQSLVYWSTLYHTCPSKLALNLGAGLVLFALQSCVLGLFPVYVVIHNQLPPASRFIVILEQIRFLMKTYSFMRESVPVIINNPPKEGENPRFPTFSSYLYFLFCPTLIYRESYPRNSHIRWEYVRVTVGMLFLCLFYGYYILERLCVPDFRPDSKRAVVLSIFHSILPGTMLLLICFFAFLHCWLNLFAELMRFADRTFYKDWWNSYSFANYYRTWNVVVHDFLYYYGYKDFLRLSKRKFRTAAMLSVFMVSAFVHEYALGMGFGFFYPVMFFLFAIFGVLFNFMMNDKRQSPVCNVLLWTSLFLGQGVQVSLYGQEWYAQIHCPPTGDSLWELLTPRSWNCTYHK